MSEMLSILNAVAGYGKTDVIRGVSLSVGEGELCAILGLNGSGKTTLLKAVCGLIPMMKGTCSIAGQDCTRMHEYKRARYISYLPQRYSALEGVPVLDAVLMGLNPHLGIFASPSSADRARAGQVLADMELNALSEKDFSQLSEGQKQMVMLARTLVQNTPVMLMDEPDSALDFLNRHRMLAQVRSLIHQNKKVGVITLHDPNYALAYCDRVLMLKEGKIAAKLELATADKEEIRRCLSIIYGDITVVEHEGRYMMLQK